jgi:hypothetical protein
MPLYYTTRNADAARMTRTDRVQAIIGGAPGITVGIWDIGAVRTTHQEFGSRATYADDEPEIVKDHATHVAGTLIAQGIDPAAKGMAYQADLVSYDWVYDLSEMASEASSGLLLSNHSYGPNYGWDLEWDGWYWHGDTVLSETEDYHFGFYDVQSNLWDEVAHAAPDYLIVLAAGNERKEGPYDANTPHFYWNSGTGQWEESTKYREKDGGSDGYDCLPAGASTAKNLLCVGMVYDFDEYRAPTDVVSHIYSSWGPTDDGRIKPDLVGNGEDLYSCADTHDVAYTVKMGTSMASPNVCGSLALLQKFYMDQHSSTPMKAATLKSLAIHTARETGDHPGPDYKCGWGLLDTYAAYGLIVEDLDDRGLIRELTLTNGGTLEFDYFCHGADSMLKVTICWNDPEATPLSPALNPPDPMLINDLDLRVEKVGGTIHEPWTLSRSFPDDPAAPGDNDRDNVEQVAVYTPEVGHYIIRITHKGTLYGGSQDVSMIVSGGERINNVWHVYEDGSGDAPDITTAVSLAVDRDLILVHPGTYEEHDIAVDKELLISSYSGPDNTIVDAQSLGRCFYLLNVAGPGKLVGFTLRNGEALGTGIYGYGGAILSTNPDAVIVNCRIAQSEAVNGGGIACYYASSGFVKCHIDNNFANTGGGIYCYESDPSLSYCVVAEDSSVYGGGGVYCSSSSPSLFRCTISGNATTMYGAGISIGGNGSAPVIENTIIAFNRGGTGVYLDAMATGLDIGCSDVYGNTAGNYGGSISDQTGINGNISSDPVFCNPVALDFGIGDGSLCRPGANPCSVLIGAYGIGCHTKTLWYVIEDGSGDATTIQYGIDVAHDGDTVLVAAGTYDGNGNKDLTTDGKSIHLLSEAGPETTIIDCDAVYFDPVAGIWITQGEDSTTIIEGFTITGADKGGIICIGSSPKIRNCIITLNENDVFEDYRGGGIYLENSDAIIIDCEILDNLTHLSGAGVYCTAGSSPRLEGSTIADNDAGAFGGGIHIDNGSTMILIDCSITGNDVYPYDGGGIFAYEATLTLENCSIDGNSAHRDGGGIYTGVVAGVTLTGSSVSNNISGDRGGGIYYYALLNMENCTIVGNSSGGYGAGLFAVNAGSGATTKTIIAFNLSGHGIYTASSTMNISCSDVYGNAAGDYGGNLPDQTGSNDNISEDPLFCDFGAGDYHIFNVSPCAPAQSPCGELIGRLDVDCLMAPDLVITEVAFNETELEIGDSLTATVKIKNIGDLGAENFYLDYFEDLSSPPTVGQIGDQRLLVASLDAGDSLIWTTDPTTNSCFEQWESYFHVDSADSALEHDEGNNIDGPFSIKWAVPLLAGWPVYSGGEFNSSPAIALLDDDPLTQEVVIGCDDGYVYAWTAEGNAVPGWPVSVGQPVQSSPAVGNVAGDYHPEVVFGCDDGYLYVYDYTGSMLWRYGTGQPIATTPALADLDNDGLLEIVLGHTNVSGEGCIYTIDDDGTDFTGSWPLVVGGTYASSAAIGDVDSDGHLEIAIAASGFTKPDLHSRVYLLDKFGADYGAGWPVVIDTVIVASPVLGNISFTDDLEVITGGINGKVYAINLSGTIWPDPPSVGGIIAQSLALTNADKEAYQEIIVSCSYYYEPVPPIGYWATRVSVLDNDGTMMAGWPSSAGTWSIGLPSLSPIAIYEKIMSGSRNGRVYGWTTSSGAAADGFPLPDRGTMGCSPAIGDLDGNGYFDLVAPANNDSVYCYDLGCSSAYRNDMALCWPMFRHDARRTGCYASQLATDADIPVESTPSVTALRSIYPNPFNPATKITFDLKKRSPVLIVIYDVAGRRVCTLVDGIREAGRHDVTWQGTSDGGYPAASGVYFCRFRTTGRIETRKMILLR